MSDGQEQNRDIRGDRYPRIGDVVWFGQQPEISPGAFRGWLVQGPSMEEPPAVPIPAIVVKIHDLSDLRSHLDLVAFCGKEPVNWPRWHIYRSEKCI